jgi:AhpD family alkylhydroperoxidase
MTQRLTQADDEDATECERMIIDGATLLLGRTANLVRVLARHSPLTARWFVGFAGAVRQLALGASTDMRLRNLVSIKTSVVNGCDYCTGHTEVLGRALGLSDREIEAIEHASRASDDPVFTERESLALEWAEAIARNTAKRDHQLWDSMKRNFTDTEIVEVTLLSAAFNMTNRLNDAFWTELEDESYNARQRDALDGVALADIDAYAASFGGMSAVEASEAHATR